MDAKIEINIKTMTHSTKNRNGDIFQALDSIQCNVRGRISDNGKWYEIAEKKWDTLRELHEDKSFVARLVNMAYFDKYGTLLGYRHGEEELDSNRG